MFADHPHTDPGDGRTECLPCGKWVWPVTHSCKGVPVTAAARARRDLGRLCCDLHNAHCEPPADLCCRNCTEAAHPQHPRGVPCVLTGTPTPTGRRTP